MATERAALWSVRAWLLKLLIQLVGKGSLPLHTSEQSKRWGSGFLCGSLGCDHSKNRPASCEWLLTIPWLALHRARFSLESQAKCFPFFLLFCTLLCIWLCSLSQRCLCSGGIRYEEIVRFPGIFLAERNDGNDLFFSEAVCQKTDAMCQLVARR